MSALSIEYSPRSLPTLRFSEHPWWARAFWGLAFLPSALRVITRRELAGHFSFHLLNAQDRVIGISEGDLRYPASPAELKDFERLIVLLEDRRFFNHRGVDLKSIGRSVLANLRARRIVQGGSTITQQLVRNTLLVPERSLLRKILEVFLAIKVEKHYSKAEILNLYCNHVYLGKGVRGFAAAARVIFRRHISSLNEAQIYGLVGLLRTPNRTFPQQDSRNFIARQKRISAFIGHGDVSHIPSPNPIDITSHRVPRFAKIVRAELAHAGIDTTSGVRRVGLTIDTHVQSALAATLLESSKLADIRSAAAIVLSIKTGDVLGEVAYEEGAIAQTSPSYFGALQPGSTFKTFALLSALQQGMSLNLPLISAPFESQCYVTTGNKPWRVRNYANTYRGVITLFEAFRHSDNTAFARLLEMLDLQRVFNVFESFDLCARQGASPAIVLGGLRRGITLLKIAAAYRAIASGGVYRRPRFVQYVELGDGSASWIERSPEHDLQLSFEVLANLKAALIGAGPLVLGSRLAGKTGTTRVGSLFAGYDDELATALWVGYNKPIPEGDPKSVRAISPFERFMNRYLGYKADFLSI